jgi:hypothetical protein
MMQRLLVIITDDFQDGAPTLVFFVDITNCTPDLYHILVSQSGVRSCRLRSLELRVLKDAISLISYDIVVMARRLIRCFD